MLRFVQKRTLYRPPDIHMYLLKDVPKVGEKGEIVLMKPEAARHYFVPYKLAYYVPKEQGKPVLPSGWTPKIVTESVMEQILPADMSIADDVYSETVQDMSTRQSETITVDQAQLTNIQIAKLRVLEFLTFERVLTKQDGVEIYGSVNVSDIVQLLEKQHGIKISKSMLFGIPESANHKGSSLPLKSIGTHHIHVVARDIDPIELVIIVKGKQ